MATRTLSSDRAVAQRLWVFAPPHQSLAGTSKLSEATVVGYVALDSDGRMRSGDVSITLLPRCQRMDLVFDCGDVFQAEVAAPRLSEGKLRLALPNLLEDRLLADPAQCHFAFMPAGRGADRAGGAPPPLPVAAIDRGLLNRLLDVLSGTGERPRAAYSAIYVLPPPTADVLSAFACRGRLAVRTAQHDGVACELDDSGEPPAALRLALRACARHRIRAYGPQAPRLAAMAEALGVAVEIAEQPLDPAAADGAVNLLQGAFARGTAFNDPARLRSSLRAWRAPLAWAAVALAVFVAGMNGYWLKLQSEAGEADAEMVDPIVQAQRELVRLRARSGQASASDFTSLNALAGQLLAAAPVGILAGIEYRDAELQLKFRSPPDPALQNQLRAQAVQQGLQIRFEAEQR